MSDKIRYKWVKDYKDQDRAIEAATWLHEPLIGNSDYQESRILLHVGEFGSVEFYEFEDSKTHVHVIEENGHPVLEMFVK